MTNQLEALITSEIAEFFACFVEIHTELGGPNTIEEAQHQLTERVTRIASECEAALIAELEGYKTAYMEWSDKTDWVQKAPANRFGFNSLGMHIADVMTQHIEQLEASKLAVKLPIAATDVLAERERQVNAEGWTPERDDGYQNSELADAAACYSINAHNQGCFVPAHWPWNPEWWKQTNPRRDLVKAGALILAEIERIDRASITVQGEE